MQEALLSFFFDLTFMWFNYGYDLQSVSSFYPKKLFVWYNWIWGLFFFVSHLNIVTRTKESENRLLSAVFLYRNWLGVKLNINIAYYTQEVRRPEKYKEMCEFEFEGNFWNLYFQNIYILFLSCLSPE